MSAVVTCHTDGCESAGRPIEIDVTYVDGETGETQWVGGVCCGACGQLITDVVPPLGDPGGLVTPEPDPEPDPEGTTKPAPQDETPAPAEADSTTREDTP